MCISFILIAAAAFVVRLGVPSFERATIHILFMYIVVVCKSNFVFL